MKQLFSLITIFALPLLLAACSSGNSDNSTTTGSAYYNTAGFMPYPNTASASYNGYPQNGYCNCPSGYSPVFNSQASFGCVQSSYVAPIAGFLGYYSLPAGNYYSNQNIPQVSNIPNSGAQSCQTTIAASCLLNEVGGCINGYTCRQVTSSSVVGLCTHN